MVDLRALKLDGQMPVGISPAQVGFLPDGSQVYVSLAWENAVAVVDTVKRQMVAKIPVGKSPIQAYATPDAKRVYVANQGTEKTPDELYR